MFLSALGFFVWFGNVSSSCLCFANFFLKEGNSYYKLSDCLRFHRNVWGFLRVQEIFHKGRSGKVAIFEPCLTLLILINTALINSGWPLATSFYFKIFNEIQNLLAICRIFFVNLSEILKIFSQSFNWPSNLKVFPNYFKIFILFDVLNDLTSI